MGVSVASLIAATRVDSGLRNNRFFSNDQIAEKLTDAYADLRDRMIIRFAFWFKKTFNFSLAGGVGGNILTLSSNVPDLEMIQYLNLLDSSGNPSPVTMLSSVAERNQYAANYPFATGNGFNGFVGRKYFPDGDDLEILPAANSLGNYELVYTPQPQRLALPVLERTFAVNGGDQPGTVGPAPSNAWLLGASQFVAEDVGRTLVPAFAAPNTAWNIPFEVTEYFSATAVSVTPDPNAIGVFDQPPSGTWSVYEQPAGTIGELPESLTPWAKYLQIQASIAIRTAQRKSIAALDLQRQVFEKRIVALTKQRSQGVTQAPITQTNYGSNFGGTFGNG
jgi:hypothetical protein